MNLQNQLKLSRKVYISVKIIQLAFQVIYEYYLLVLAYYDKEDTQSFTNICSFILIGVFISYCRLLTKEDYIFGENGNYVDNCLIVFELTNFVIAVIVNSILIYKMEAKYEDKEELYYAHHNNDSLPLKVDELSRNTRDLLNETIEEIYTISIPVNFSKVDVRKKYHEKKVHTPLHVPSDLMFEAFYFMYVTLRLKIPAIACSVIQGYMVVMLGWIEFIKYKIRKAKAQQPPPAVEMAILGGAEREDNSLD